MSAAPSQGVLEQAAEWFALLQSGEATRADRQAWRAWHDSAEAHRAAWAQVERVGRIFQPIRQAPDPRLTVGAYRTATADAGRRRLVLGLAALAGAGLLGGAAWRPSLLPGALLAWTADHRTGVGEVREIALQDGTRVWLGTGSAFDEDFGAALRRLELVAGEILISTASDPGRPFVVDTPRGRLRALGTRFSVRLQDGDARIAVYDGAVRAQTAGGAGGVIPSGMQARLTRAGLAGLEPAVASAEASTRGLYIAQDIPLGDVLRELGRYRAGYLSVSPQVAGLPVFGSYPMTEPDRALAMLESVLPIRVSRPLPWWVRVGPR
ncbi:FecR domain-containing protein [Achromobacter pulmonis]|uniref:FecR domain-containing protein n=1 Tax=Achromobacter pulmonis TaxID=1389932 RepID=UPI002159E42F|nr:FecR domain-containing protein [Achromobacter pulmonis]